MRSSERSCLSKVSHVLDVDIKGYFNNIVHEHLMTFIQRRIRDRSHLRLLGKWLHVGSAGRRTTAASHDGHGSRRGDQSRAGQRVSVTTLQRGLYRAAKAQPGRKFHSLYDKVYRPDVLWQAWVEVKANRGAPGIDAQSVGAAIASGEEAFVR